MADKSDLAITHSEDRPSVNLNRLSSLFPSPKTDLTFIDSYDQR